MNKQGIKIIKRPDGKAKSSPPAKAVPKKKKRSLESTIQNWITERRENEDTENRTRNSEFQSWNTEPAEAV
ncbi:MAG TPA: hypothetical protein VFZ23_01350 [Pyrinomonadaceae bacterium]